MHRPITTLLAIMTCALFFPAQQTSGHFVTGLQPGLSASGYITVPHNARLTGNPNLIGTMPVTGVTVEAWIRYTEITPNFAALYPTIARAGETNWSWFLRVNAAANGARILQWNVSNQTPTGGGGVHPLTYAFGPGELACWTHVAGTWDNVTGESKLYVNGVLAGSRIAPGPLRDAGSTFLIGNGRFSQSAEIWNGDIDQVRVYSTVLDEATIRGVMFLPLFGFPGLEAEWLLDGNALNNTGNTVYDGTEVNTVTYTAAAAPQFLEYQTNGQGATLRFDGQSASGECDNVLTMAFGQTAVLALSSDVPAGFPFQIVVTLGEALVPLSGAGIATANGQILNVNLASPGLTPIFAGTGALWPGGQFMAPVTALPVPAIAGIQFVIIDPSHADGFSLSAGVTVIVQ
ncbi:MAG: LamG domain-containing protein [Planctomycetes bacterium]|nr:LamG domain-containing protein [Planctomycetota bacterium]